MTNYQKFNLDLDESIESLFPIDCSGSVVALRGCIDASTRTTGVFSVSGVAFGFERAKKANREWERLLNGRVFHMTDLNAREKEFEGISDEEVEKIMIGVVGITKRYASYIVSVSCNAELIRDHLPTICSQDVDSREILRAFRSPYGMMCHLCMYQLGLLAEARNPRKRQISYIFEKGDDGQRGLIRFIDFLANEPSREFILNCYSMARYTVTPKDEIEGLFHSSDLVAWEWAKHVERKLDGKSTRISFSELLGENYDEKKTKYGFLATNANSRFFYHYQGQNFEKLLEHWRIMIAADDAGPSLEAFNRWRSDHASLSS